VWHALKEQVRQLRAWKHRLDQPLEQLPHGAWELLKRHQYDLRSIDQLIVEDSMTREPKRDYSKK
jgi:hypothetical protein